MKITPGQRRIALAIGLAATLGAALRAHDAEPEGEPGGRTRPDAKSPAPPAVQPGRARTPRAQEVAPVVALERFASRAARPAEHGPAVDAFAPRDWQEPAREAERRARAAKAEAASPPQPQAPALPFQFLGMMHDAGRTSVFLAQGDRNHIVRQGDAIDASWRLDRITDRAVLITYVPLGIQQALPLGGLF